MELVVLDGELQSRGDAEDPSVEVARHLEEREAELHLAPHARAQVEPLVFVAEDPVVKRGATHPEAWQLRVIARGIVEEAVVHLSVCTYRVEREQVCRPLLAGTGVAGTLHHASLRGIDDECGVALVEVDGHPAVEGLHGGFHLADVAHGARLYHEVPHAVCAGLLLDAGQCAEEPLVDLPEHEMVFRGTLARVPLLRQRRGPLRQLEAVARRLVVVEHLEEQVVVAVVGQHAEEVAVAHVARGEPVAMGVDVADEGIQHVGLVLPGDAEEEGQGVARLAPGAIVA